MAKISLRAYVREVEGMIDSGRIEEAIGHCRYILNYFPKHIDTYRLLGKAYLEIQRYSDAADILQRVLSAIPDDFIAHLGMSIIREDEGNIDAAIWHMERAFEVQPSNAAIQSELRRLFGRRDGVEPPKIQLTRGALARMYAKGSLYPQAIAELRAALAEDPRRPDLEVILARMYYLNGQRIEAAETCSSIHNSLPFCLEANLLLAEILQDTERASEAKAYRHRVQRLDPYAAHVSKAAPTPDKVSDSAVTIEKLDWTPGEVYSGAKAQPDWATSLGVEVDELVPGGESLPDWLSTAEQAETEDFDDELSELDSDTIGEEDKEELAGEPEAEDEAAVPAEELPDWMKSAGWEAAQESQETEATTMDFNEEEFNESGDDIEKGDIPDWLKDIAPEESVENEDFDLPSEGEPELGVPSWLEETPPGPTDSIATWLDEQDDEGEVGEQAPQPNAQEAEQPDIPDWLKDLGEEPPVQSEEEVHELTEDDSFSFEAEATAATDIPDWLRELSEEEETVSETPMQEEPSEPVEEGEVEGDWVQESEGEDTWDKAPSGEIEEQPLEEEREEFTHPHDTKILADGSLEQSEFETSEAVPDLESMDEDATMAWLESLAAKQGASEEELLTSPDEREHAPPAWVKKYTTELSAEAVEPEPEGETDESEFEVETEEFETVTAEAEIISTQEETEMEEDLGEPDMPEIPDWLLEMEGETSSMEAGEAVPDWLITTERAEDLPEEALGEPVPEAESPDWVEAQEFDITGTDEPPVSEPEGTFASAEPEQEAIPDWLHGLDEEFTGVESEDVTVEPSEGDIPEWLKAASLGAAADAAEAEELPEWIHGAEEAAPPEEVEATVEDESFEPLEPEEITEPITGDTEPVRVKPASEEESEPIALEAAETEAEDEEVEFVFEEDEPETVQPEEIEAELYEEEEVEVEFVEEPVEPEIEETAAAEPEIPAWLSEYAEEGEEIEAEEYAWEPSAVEEPAAEVDAEIEVKVEAEVEPEPEPEVEEPRELLDVNTASLSQLENLPGIGFITAQNIIAYRESFGPFQGNEDLNKVSGIGPETLAELEKYVTVVKETEAPQPAEIDFDKPDQILEAGRELLREGDVDQALEHYNRLIAQKQDLGSVIEDLQNALFNHPMNIQLYQSLGDAHMRNDQLQDALDVYTKAEELLR